MRDNTDEWGGYKSLPRYHYYVNHSEKEYVRDTISTNGIESLWACFKRSYKGIYHKMSPKHMQRYVNGCCGRLNMRDLKTGGQVGPDGQEDGREALALRGIDSPQ